MDASSCSLGLRENLALDGVEVIDSVSWVHDHLLERLEITQRLGSVVIHPTCATGHLGASGKLAADRRPSRRRGRRAGGDALLRHGRRPGLAAPRAPRRGAGRHGRRARRPDFDACVSSNRTCEIALQQVTGRPYESLVFTLEALTRS